MATIKNHTDLSQSKTLSKILPLESADMWFANGIIVGRDSVNEPDDIKSVFPCWSLAALLSVVSEVSLNSFKNGSWYVMIQQNGKSIYTNADNAVDACYKLILKLHELKLL